VRCGPAESLCSPATAAAPPMRSTSPANSCAGSITTAPLAPIALTTDSSVLTAVANDYSYESVLERQIRGLGRAGDVLIAISTSGRSRNILRAIAAAQQQRLTIVGLTGGSGGEMAPHHLRPKGPVSAGQLLLNWLFRPGRDITAHIGRYFSIGNGAGLRRRSRQYARACHNTC
jgi:SIS domain-containing protein